MADQSPFDTKSPMVQELLKRAMTEQDATSSAASSPKPAGPAMWAKLLYGAGLGADYASTASGIASNPHDPSAAQVHEGNPMVNFAGDKAAIPIGIGESAGAMFLASKLLKNHPTLMNALLAGMGGMHGAYAVKGLVVKQQRDDMNTPKK